MPVRRQSRKPAARKPRMMRRKPRVARWIKPANVIHRFTRDVQYTLANPGLVTPFFFAQSYALNQLPNNTDFTNLFDQYRITYVKMFFRLEVDPSAQAAAGAVYPCLSTFNDFNDTTVPTSVDQFRERSKKRVTHLRPGKAVVRTIRPAITDSILKGPTGVAVTCPRWKQWLPTANNDIGYIGTKWMIENWTNANYVINQQVRYYVQCKQVQ